MTKLKLFLITLLSVVSCYASAGNPEDDPFYNDNGYSAKECRKVTNPKSACNQGAEPFYKFIKKFKTNSAFRKSRTYKNGEFYADMKEIVYSLKKTIGEKRYWSKDKTDPRGGFYTYTTCYWYGVTKNTVCFRYNVETDHEIDGDGWGLACEFERINGKWYLIKALAAG